MTLKSLLITMTITSLAFSATTLAKKPEGKGNSHNKGNNSRWENSNKQSDPYSLRGKARAEERHQSKKYKQKHAGKHGKNRDSYEHRRYQEKYRNNPVVPIFDRSINDAKSKIHEVQRKAIETIDRETRAIITDEKPNQNNRWWWPF